MRRKNKKDMTITEQIEDVAEIMCNDYCKYPAIYHERWLSDEYKDSDESDQAMQNEQCNNCPLMRL